MRDRMRISVPMMNHTPMHQRQIHCKHVHHATLAPPMVEDTIPVVPRVSELLQEQRMVSSIIQHLFHRLSQPTMDLIL